MKWSVSVFFEVRERYLSLFYNNLVTFSPLKHCKKTKKQNYNIWQIIIVKVVKSASCLHTQQRMLYSSLQFSVSSKAPLSQLATDDCLNILYLYILLH